jgi:hypothetical protein
MTRDQKIINRKVGLLELAKHPGNVSHACKILGHWRYSVDNVVGVRLIAGCGSLPRVELLRARLCAMNRGIRSV